jgi:hypothetical protein
LTDWHWRTEHVHQRLALPGWTIRDENQLSAADGQRIVVVGVPAQRVWAHGGILSSAAPVDWSLQSTADGAELCVATDADVDLLTVDVDTARAMDTDAPAMTVLGSFARLAGVGDLGRFLVGDEVLDTNDFGGRRCSSEQTALSVYRIARLRGGPFWSAVASHVAAVVRRRIATAPDGLPVHGAYGGAETHTRFLADALFLMVADGDAATARTAADGLGNLTTSYDGGRWVLHDSRERDRGENHLVLNTHVQATLARSALGDDVSGEISALERVLSLRPAHARRGLLAARLLAADAAEGWLGRRPAGSAQRAAAATRKSRAHLALPGGWLARDAGLGPAPAYLTVNLYDLAALTANVRCPAATLALRRGMRYARVSGYFRAQRRARHPQAAVQPIALRLAGCLHAAERAATAATRAGWAPAVGWPGYEDRLWPTLAPGTP